MHCRRTINEFPSMRRTHRFTQHIYRHIHDIQKKFNVIFLLLLFLSISKIILKILLLHFLFIIIFSFHIENIVQKLNKT